MDVFAAIAQPTRRSILEMLAGSGQLPASDIASRFKLSPPAISQHLKILREARLVRMHKHRQQRIYQINPEAVQQVEAWARGIEMLWAERFDRLEALLEADQMPRTPFNDPKETRNDRTGGSRKQRDRGHT
jgi:DNA-binding transcriptional ArsR family regulator